MTAAPRYLPNYTVADYQTWKGDWELWQGIPVSMTPSPFGPHQRVAKNLVFELESQIRRRHCEASVLYEIDWIISEDTVVRPDIVLLCGEAPEQHLRSAPAMIAEVLSDSTANRDREAKRNLYEEHGVENYLLIDPDRQTLEIYRKEQEPRWRHRVVIDEVTLMLCGDCELAIHRDSLFR
jgi:Uma2 family endonuclease